MKVDNGVKAKLPANANTPMQATYHPELDVSPEFDVKYMSYYQLLAGVLCWMVELGRVDICLEVSLLSSHLALLREGHFEQVMQVFSYLKKFHNPELIYDPSDAVVDEGQFHNKDWASSKFGHVDGQEELLERMPEPRVWVS